MSNAARLGPERAELRSIIEQTRLPLAACDASGRLTMLSPSLEELFEQRFEPVCEPDYPTRFHLYGSDGLTPLPEDDVPLTRARRGEVVTEAVVSTRRTDGCMAFLRCNAAPMRGPDGAIAGAVVHIQDITAERSAQHEQDELRERLMDTINHELRTPLTKLVGHTELLFDVRDSAPDKMQRSIGAVAAAAQELSQLLETLSHLIDLDSHTRLKKQYSNLAGLLRETAMDFARENLLNGIQVSLSLPERLTATVDPDETRRAVWELLKNAATFGPDASEIWLGLTSDATMAYISVTDTGCGIPAKERARLMRPLERGKHANQPVNSKGLGLAIAHTVASAHGGRLALGDRLPHGLRATLVLPRFGHAIE